MLTSSQRTSAIVAALIFVGITLPLAGYWVLYGRISTVLPQEAQQLLADSPASVVLVDVRSPESFAVGHIVGAVEWPLEKILLAARQDQIPPPLRGKTLLMLCEVGVASRVAVAHFNQAGLGQAINVRGGIQEWMRCNPQHDSRPGHWRTPAGLGSFPYRDSPPAEQALAVLSYFFIKPIYMFLSLVVVALLWRSTASDLVALRWGMIAFFLGEAACAVNYFGYKETSYLWEYLHGAGMFVCFGFLAYAVLEAIDDRLLGLSDPQRRCAGVRLCGACCKTADVACGLQRAFYLFIPATMAVAMMVPTSDWHDTSYNTTVFGHPYNYGHLRVFQQFELWYCPAAAVVMLAASLVILLCKRRDAIGPAKIAFAAGLGPLGFGMLRMLLGAAYDQNRVWFLFWEEATEFLMVFGVCCLLWIFRHGLFPGVDEWFRAKIAALGLELNASDREPAAGEQTE
jgi:thiosulfate sulfurtransferase